MKVLLAMALAAAGIAAAQDALDIRLDDPAIEYETRPTTDPVARLNDAIASGRVELTHEAGRGYLTDVLRALDVPRESQVLVFSKTSLQAAHIGPARPRAIYFNDRVSVAWIPEAPLLEIAAHDERQGVIFYGLDQREDGTPVFRRNSTCLECHVSTETRGVPGIGVGSVGLEPDGTLLPGGEHRLSDHRTPFERRWGGWFFTGALPPGRHLGRPLDARVPIDRYLTPHSDPVALMVLEHQALVTNLLTRLGWITRLQGDTSPETRSLVDALVDALTFDGEAPLPGAMPASSGFVAAFEAQGPRDAAGRSLREFDLRTRLMRYPCSYMVYSPAFDALPDPVRVSVWRTLRDRLARVPGGPAAWEILSETRALPTVQPEP